MKDRKRDAVNCKRRTERGKEKKERTLLGLLSIYKIHQTLPARRDEGEEKRKKNGGKKPLSW